MSTRENSVVRKIRASDPVSGPTAIADLVALDTEGGGWRNRQCLLNIPGQILGGQLAAHCLMAAAAGERSLEPSGLHILFVGAADPDRAYHLETDNLRTGRRMAHRSVRLTQGGKSIVKASAILQVPSDKERSSGPSFCPEMPQVLSPEASTARRVAPGESDWLNVQRMEAYPFLKIRETQGCSPGGCQIDGSSAYYWIRLPDCASLPTIDQYALLTLASDFWFTLPMHSVSIAERTPFVTTSLDHTMWFHRPHNFSEWALVETECVLIEEDIGLMRARFWSRTGLPIATVMQQALIRDAPVR